MYNVPLPKLIDIDDERTVTHAKFVEIVFVLLVVLQLVTLQHMQILQAIILVKEKIKKNHYYIAEIGAKPEAWISSPSSPDFTNYVCNTCSAGFRRIADLHRHKCGPPPRYSCPYCHKKDNYSSNINRHVKRSLPMLMINRAAPSFRSLPITKDLTAVWMAQYAYHCDKCGKGYQHRATLLRHTRHECGKEPKFKCPYCPHKTKQRGNLYQHIRTNHPGKNVFSDTA
ncbi:PREDICTED: zinc finger protein 534-like [Ceratosolen solmsi marchali]|uniref:Zinc finger protein 534-like n=1 Tax=Ceratosolen solmsi marchali TaxID=326594 RepID=A0AAJ6YMG9_9HYME|nr:PREDICTED: zinc finger protein 534-like [Ceratosolen solmsi marchali]